MALDQKVRGQGHKVIGGGCWPLLTIMRLLWQNDMRFLTGEWPPYSF